MVTFGNHLYPIEAPATSRLQRKGHQVLGAETEDTISYIITITYRDKNGPVRLKKDEDF